MAPYYTRLYQVAPTAGTPRVVIDRAGMNTSPQFSPDGQRVAFVTTSGRVGLLCPARPRASPRLSRSPGPHRPPRSAPIPDERRVDRRDGCGHPDSRVVVRADERGHVCDRRAHVRDADRAREHRQRPRGARGARPGRELLDERQPRRTDARLSTSRSAHDGRCRGARRCHGQSTTVTRSIPSSRSIRVGRLEPISWRSFDGKGNLGPAAHAAWPQWRGARTCRCSSTAMAGRSAA